MRPFQPTLESVQTHEVPAWFHDAKFGIFLHWGMSSIPAYAPTDDDFDDSLDGNLRLFEQSPYAEWYLNGLRIPGSRIAKYHAEHFGRDAPYDIFREPFEIELAKAEPADWASLARRAGAKYLVQVTKHHDGYCLWPTAHDNPKKLGWWSSRDIVGETARAVRAEGLRYGTYYSVGLDWMYDEQVLGNFADLVLGIPQSEEYRLYAENHLKELVERYKPDILWNDIGYPDGDSLWRILADFYNANPDGVVNDRWQQVGPLREALSDPATYEAVVAAANKAQYEGGGGFEPPLPPHCDFRSPEYTHYDEIQEKKWESTRGIGKSFGYRKNEPEDAILTFEELVQSFVDIVSKNGNLLLNIGPMSNGTVPDYQINLLEAMGKWLDVNGEGIYESRPWIQGGLGRAEGKTLCGQSVRFTTKGQRLFAYLLGKPKSDSFEIEGIEIKSHRWLGTDKPLSGGKMKLPGGLEDAPAYGLELSLQDLSSLD
jgi:alpha-L-fucosidase